MNEVAPLPDGWESPLRMAPNPLVGGLGLPVQQPVYGEDSQLSVHFVLYPEIHHQKTIEAGYKVIEYREYVHIQKPGDKTTVYFQPAEDRHRRRFPLQYRAFKENRVEHVGVPLEAWEYQLSQTQIYTMKLLGVNYVHQIANMSPQDQLSLGVDAKDIVARAKITVQDLSTKEANAHLLQKLEDMKRELEELKRKEAERSADEDYQLDRIRETKERESQKAEEREREGFERLLSEAAGNNHEGAAALSEAAQRRRRR